MFKLKFRCWDFGLISCAIGIGIFLGLILPPLGWMIGCAIVLIICGILLCKKC